MKKTVILVLLMIIVVTYSKSPYDAKVVKIYDADTFTCDIELGLDIVLKKQKIRLSDIDAPEMRGLEKLEGKLARDYIRNVIFNEQDSLVILDIFGKGKYGRWIANVWITSDTGMVCVNKMLVQNNYAVEKKY